MKIKFFKNLFSNGIRTHDHRRTRQRTQPFGHTLLEISVCYFLMCKVHSKYLIEIKIWKNQIPNGIRTHDHRRTRQRTQPLGHAQLGISVCYFLMH